jgi:hypothetical protein
VLRCRLAGHRFVFTNEGATMHWRCVRGCGASGEKTYPTAAEAARYARAFDRRDIDRLGERAPLIALLPLRIARLLRSRR